MIPFLADHCFDEDILIAVIRRNPSIDFVLARDEGLQEAEDPDILAWAAEKGRVVITHDRNTMIAFALERMRGRQPMTGLVVINRFAPYRDSLRISYSSANVLISRSGTTVLSMCRSSAAG